MSAFTPMTPKDKERTGMSPLIPPKNKNIW